ncbi:MAG: DUF2634 domain-containing protein [Selenomonadaceae bacterium]|nr:DUF2634 domain-containing protein [Selenomonadaceae bacterium]MBR3721772.1 DUF2634 domain-containing protein [Selenomonadaceae bacterium]
MANPFIAMDASVVETTEEELPYLEEYAWDFEHNCFRYDKNGNHIIVTETEAIKVWVYKCLKCERFLYNVYRHGVYNDRCNYGVWLEKYIGKNPNDEKTASAVRKEIRAAILANPYIETIDYLEIASLDGDTLTLNMGLTSIYGSLEMRGLEIVRD